MSFREIGSAMARFSYTATMKSDHDPKNLNLAALAQTGGQVHAETRLARFDRLLEETQGLGGEAVVRYTATGSLRTDPAGVDEVWMHLELALDMPLTCQRCLGPVDEAIAFEREFRFVATEELAAIEDEESEEDVLVLSKNFDLQALVEDEILMSLPSTPKHEVCPVQIKLQVADPDFVEPDAEKVNPFAVLEQLKKGGAS